MELLILISVIAGVIFFSWVLMAPMIDDWTNQQYIKELDELERKSLEEWKRRKQLKEQKLVQRKLEHELRLRRKRNSK